MSCSRTLTQPENPNLREDRFSGLDTYNQLNNTNFAPGLSFAFALHNDESFVADQKLLEGRFVNRRHTLSLIVAFAAGGVAAVWIPRLIGDIADRVIFPKHREEVQRINSPDGVVDAAVERIDCGVPAVWITP